MIDARIQLSGNGKWVRNNPEEHKAPSVDREISIVDHMAAMATEKDILLIDEKLKEKRWEDAP